MDPLFPRLGFLPGEYELRQAGVPAVELLQMLNPITAAENAMVQAGRAADSELSPEERRGAAGEAALETGLFLVPGIGGLLARQVGRAAPRVAGQLADEAGDVMETLTAVRPDVEAPIRANAFADPAVPPGAFDDIPYDEDAYIEAELDRIFGPAPAPAPAPDTELDPNEWPYDVFNENVPAVNPADQNLQNTPEEEFFAPGYYLLSRIADLTEDDIVGLNTNTLRAALDNASDDLEQLAIEGAGDDDAYNFNLRIRPVLQRIIQELDDRDQEAGAFETAFADDDAFNPELFFPPSRNGETLEPEQTGMLSTVGRASLDLEQPRYGSYNEVIANLKRLGAREAELRASGIGSLRNVEGPITQDMIQEAISNDNPLEVVRYRGSNTEYPVYFTPGGENYREVVIRSPNALNILEGTDITAIPPDHFQSAGSNQIVHYRAANFPVEGGETFHVGEIQSDWAQNLRDAREELAISRMTPEQASKTASEVESLWEEVVGRFDDLQERQRQLDEDYNSGLVQTEDWGAQSREIASGIEQTRVDFNSLDRDREILSRYWDNLGGEGAPVRTNIGEPFVPEGPLVSSTNDVTQLAIRQALLDAANSPQNYLTFGTGEMAHSFTGGVLSGQQKYYDEIVPRQLRKTLQRLAREYDIEVPEIELVQMFSNDRSESYMVPGIQITPELRQAIADYGMPMFKDGGSVYAGIGSMGREAL